MLAARNRWFRIAVALAGVAWLILAVLEAIDVHHLVRELVPGGYYLGDVLFTASNLVGAVGWLIVASGFGPELNWRRLRAGATILASVYIAFFVGSLSRMFGVLGTAHDGDYRAAYICMGIAALFAAVGACLIASGFAEARRGSARANRLWLGLAFAAVGVLQGTVSVLCLQAYYSSSGAVHETTIGTLIIAVGVFGTAVATMVGAKGAQEQFASREAKLAAAATIGAVASLCIAGGEVLVALAYSNHGGATWEQVVAWLAVPSRLAFVFALSALALGARAARDDSVLGVAGAA